ncbi:NADPH-dependent F420 reductase [Microbacterium tumbae]
MLTTIAVLGVGRVGAAVARTALAAGLEVHVAGSGAAEDIALLAEIVIPGAVPMTAADAVRGSDLVVLAVPLHRFRTVGPATLDGRIVVDVMNHWAPIDGVLGEFDDDPRGTSEIVAERLAGARVVKALNHIGYHELEDDARRDARGGRRALAYATDHDDAAAAVHELLDRFGFDPVHAGTLASGIAFEPGTPIFAGALDAAGMRRALTEAKTLVAEQADLAISGC